MATNYVRRYPQSGRSSVNVGRAERKLSLALGVGLALAGLLSRGRMRRTLTMSGTSLALRGAAGWCPVYAATGVNRSDSRPAVRRRRTNTKEALAGTRGLNVRDRITIRRDIRTVYQFWRRLENLPRLIDHLESVTQTDETYSHWVARGPFGLRVEWDAQIINEIPHRLLAWRSLEGSDLVSAGSVTFRETPLGTEVTVSMQYSLPAGKTGAALAWFLGDTPAQQLRDGLERLQEELETETSGVV